MPKKGFHFFVFLAPIGAAVLLSGFAPQTPALMGMPFQTRLELVEVDSITELKLLFDDMQYSWPLAPDAQVPAVSVSELPEDIAQLRNVAEKKSMFFRTLLPIALAETEVIEELRRHVLSIFRAGVDVDESEGRWLHALADYYYVEGDLRNRHVQKELLSRVDVVPVELVLAQAANESAWGTSRFALTGNNLFGHWTFQQSEGIVPKERPAGERYAVRKFPTINASVRAYMHNLNTNDAYREFRQLRANMRRSKREMDAHVLAAGLKAYSVRGSEYVKEIRSMMKGNELSSTLKNASLK